MLNAGLLPRAYVNQARISSDAGARYHVLLAQLRRPSPSRALLGRRRTN